MCEKLRRAARAALLVMLVAALTEAHLDAAGAAVTAGPRHRPAQSSAPTPGTTSSSTVAATPGSQEVGVVDKVAVRGAIIRGRVRLAPANVPLRNVRVTLRGAPGVRDLSSATTDDEGYFELRNLLPGEYRVLATRPGFVMSEQDRSLDPMTAGRTVILGEGAIVDDVEFLLWPGAIVSGQILDASGEPLAGAVVHVHREQFHDGRPWPHPDAAGLDLTDDLGRFRVFGLPPGNYFVSARATSAPQISGPSGGALALGATYFPGTTIGAEGRLIPLQAGDEVGGIVFAVIREPDPMPAQAVIAASPLTVPPADRPVATARPATIRGRIVRQGDQASIGGADVLLRTASGARVVRTAKTDAGGRFEIAGLEPGGYTLAGSRRGYATLHFGQRSPGDPAESIVLDEGEAIDVTLALAGGGALEGGVVDGGGEPVAGVIVRALRQQWVRGRQQLVVVPVAPDRTDDRGAFRLHSLAPGTYFLSATIPAQVEMPTQSWAVGGLGLMMLFPGSTSLVEAQPIALRAAEDLGGFVFTALDVRPVTVSGVVQDDWGRRVRTPSVSLMQRHPLMAGAESTHGGAGEADGSFTITNVLPGEYTIVAVPTDLPDRMAYEQIVVSDTHLTVPLVLRRGGTFAGRIVFESDSDRKLLSPQAVRVQLDPWEPNHLFRVVPHLTPPPSDWNFEIRGVVGTRRLHVAVPAGWAVQSARIGNTDVLDVPLEFTGTDVTGAEIVLTRRLSEVSGRVVDARGAPVPHAIVVIFAEDRQRRGPESRFVASVLSDRLGRFRHRGLPAERYLAGAVLGLEPGEETNPAVLDRLQDRAPTRVTVADGEALQIDVPLLDAR